MPTSSEVGFASKLRALVTSRFWRGGHWEDLGSLSRQDKQLHCLLPWGLWKVMGGNGNGLTC